MGENPLTGCRCMKILEHTSPLDARKRKAPSEYIRLVAETPIVEKGLLRPTLAAYFTSVCETVNPGHQEQEWTYGCMGPDLATILLATDATIIHGIDLAPYDANEIYSCTRTARILEYPKAMTQCIFERALHGYFFYDGDSYLRMINMLLARELRVLAAENSEISVQERDGIIQIDFVFAYPGRAPQPRRVFLHKSDIMTYLLSTAQIGDGYFQKAAMDRHTFANGPLMEEMHRRMKPEALFVSTVIQNSDTLTEYKPDDEREKFSSQVSAYGFSSVSMPSIYEEKLLLSKHYSQDRRERVVYGNLLAVAKRSS